MKRSERASPSASATPAIAIDGLTKCFHPTVLQLTPFPRLRRQAPVIALQDVTLTLPQGEVLALLGTNGAGKSTLLKILATLILPTSGTIAIDGLELVGQADRVRARVGLVTGEERSFYWRLSGRDNLEFFAAFQGLTASAARERIEELRGQLQLEALDRPFGLYSTGMRHRLAIARALLARPPILLLDEPTRSLDPLSKAAMQQLIREVLVRKLGCTVLLATHDLGEAEQVCDRAVVLHRGRVVGASRLGEQSRRSGTLEELFVRLIAAERNEEQPA